MHESEAPTIQLKGGCSKGDYVERLCGFLHNEEYPPKRGSFGQECMRTVQNRRTLALRYCMIYVHP